MKQNIQDKNKKRLKQTIQEIQFFFFNFCSNVFFRALLYWRALFFYHYASPNLKKQKRICLDFTLFRALFFIPIFWCVFFSFEPFFLLFFEGPRFWAPFRRQMKMVFFFSLCFFMSTFFWRVVFFLCPSPAGRPSI